MAEMDGLEAGQIDYVLVFSKSPILMMFILICQQDFM